VKCKPGKQLHKIRFKKIRNRRLTKSNSFLSKLFTIKIAAFGKLDVRFGDANEICRIFIRTNKYSEILDEKLRYRTYLFSMTK